MADPIREALCELCKAVQEQFFGADSYLSPRVTKATNEAAQLLYRLDAQPTPTAARTALAAEPAFVASEPSDEDLADLAEVFNGDPVPAMRRALELWGRPTISSLAAEPPAPAPAIPLDLDALLSPEGPYEPGTGQEDGAQLVDLCWWAPVHGCDTLENLLDRIRRRILPHLRPPIAGIDVPSTDGDYGGLKELCDAEGVDVRIGAPLLKRAREAWGAAQPPAPAELTPVAYDAGSGVGIERIIAEDGDWSVRNSRHISPVTGFPTAAAAWAALQQARRQEVGDE